MTEAHSAMAQQLRNYGVHDTDALTLFPAVYVAWADQTVSALTAADRSSLLDQARAQLSPGVATTLASWLKACPVSGPLSDSLRMLVAKAYDQYRLYVGYDDLQSLLIHGEGMARHAALEFGKRFSIAPPRQQIALEMATELGVRDGSSWDRFVEQQGLQPRPPPPRSVAAPSRSEVEPAGPASEPLETRVYGRPLRRYRAIARADEKLAGDPSGGIA